jgi:nicotinate-nucleotide adenylyltransferase
LIPAGQPWQKVTAGNIASAQQRLAMVEAAIDGADRFVVNPIEVARDGPSYTVDTAQQLLDRKLDPGAANIDWLIGADTLTRLASWHDAARLFRLVNFLVMQRPGTIIDFDSLPDGCRATPVSAPAIDISATDIRRRVAMDLPIDFLTPAPVVRYIAEQGLYRNR